MWKAGVEIIRYFLFLHHYLSPSLTILILYLNIFLFVYPIGGLLSSLSLGTSRLHWNFPVVRAVHHAAGIPCERLNIGTNKGNEREGTSLFVCLFVFVFCGVCGDLWWELWFVDIMCAFWIVPFTNKMQCNSHWLLHYVCMCIAFTPHSVCEVNDKANETVGAEGTVGTAADHRHRPVSIIWIAFWAVLFCCQNTCI